MMNVIMVTAQTDAAAARRLIGEHLTDPRMRTQAEEMVDNFARGMVPLPTGGFAAPGGPIGGRATAIPPGAVGGTPFIGPRPPEPGLIALPPGAVTTGPIPPIPPPTDERPTATRQ
jgi:hypothetical protein